MSPHMRHVEAVSPTLGPQVEESTEEGDRFRRNVGGVIPAHPLEQYRSKG